MKKVLLVLFLISFSFLLASCDETADTKEAVELSNEQITEKINDVLDAKSYETQFQARVNTDEMEISFQPLLTIQKYTDENDKVMAHVKYYNKIMEGAGLDAFEIYVDEANEMMYLNNTQTWYNGDIKELGDMNPYLTYSDGIDAETQGHIEAIQDILLNSIKDFTKATYVDVLDDGDRQLAHYELEYNVYNVIKSIYDYIDQNIESSGYDSFEAVLQDADVQDIMDIFKTFTVDIYLDTETLTIGRIELDLMNILNNQLIIDKIQEEIDEEDVNFGTMLEYVNDIEIALNIYQLNSLPEITIPNEAKSGYDLELLNAPFNPDELRDITLNQPTTFTMDLNDDLYYAFTIDSPTDVTVSINGTDTPFCMMYDSDYSFLDYSSYDYYAEQSIYHLTEAGTYYLNLYYGSGSVTLEVSTID